MDRYRTPHVCFRFETLHRGEVDELVMQMLEQHLRPRVDAFGTIAKRRWFLPMWICALQVGGRAFGLTLTKSPLAETERIVQIGSLDQWEGGGLLERLRGRKPKPVPFMSDLRMICQEIHTFLTKTPGFTAIRWYFETRSGQAKGVATPDELQW
jgi:hypothetical protein